MIFTYVLELLRAPFALDKQRREEIKTLKDTQTKEVAALQTSLDEAQRNLDEARSHKLTFENAAIILSKLLRNINEPIISSSLLATESIAAM